MADPGWTRLATKLGELESVGLDALEQSVSMTRRFDDKFLLDLDAVEHLLASLGPTWSVLEVDGRRLTRYHTTYFDTPELGCYRDHLQGRRRRYKVRTRRYDVDGPTMLEVKLKGAAGRTEKARWSYSSSVPERLDEPGLALVDGALREAYGRPVAEPLVRSVATTFDRVNLVDVERQERITIDVGFTASAHDQVSRFDDRRAIVEIKAPVRASDAFRRMMHLGHRPMAVSKYCLGVVTLHPEIRGNPWLPTVRSMAPEVGPVR